MIRALFTILSILFIQVNSQLCFTQQQVQTSNNLFSYKGNVYDITNYNHPGGAAKLSLTIGNSLENFVNLPQYKFHLSSPKFTSDLSNILVGILCTNTYPVETTSTIIQTTKVPVETPSTIIQTTKVPVETTSVTVQTTKVPIETTSTIIQTTKINDMTSEAIIINQNFCYFTTIILGIIMTIN